MQMHWRNEKICNFVSAAENLFYLSGPFLHTFPAPVLSLKRICKKCFIVSFPHIFAKLETNIA